MSMVKKFISLFIIMCLLLYPGLLSNAENNLILRSGDKAFYIEQASRQGSSFPYKVIKDNGSFRIIDEYSGITAVVSTLSMDESAAHALRKYYNDSSLSNEDAFNKLVDISESYIDAALESCKTNFLYGTGGQTGAEANMKLFKKASQQLYGQSSDIFVYNTLSSSDSEYSEYTHMDIFVPFHPSFTILNISFAIKSGSLDTYSIDTINNMLDSIGFSGLPFQEKPLEILNDSALVDTVNSGIYPAAVKPSRLVNSLVEIRQGFKLNYPASLVQYVQNSVGDTQYYNSFKVSPDEIFTISVEPVELPGSPAVEPAESTDLSKSTESPVSPESAAEYKATVIKSTAGNDMTVNSEGVTITKSGSFKFIDYTVRHAGYDSYYKDYIAVNAGKLYRLKFESRRKQPSELAAKAFSMIFSSFEFINEPAKLSDKEDTIGGSIVSAPAEISAMNGFAAANVSLPAAGMQEYYNEKTGLSFEYPESWQLEETGSDRMKLSIPEISDFLDIYISRNSTGKLASNPNMGLQSTLLNCSIINNRNATYIYKQVNYLDKGRKGRLCSSIEIACNDIIYSMVIDVNSSWAKGGNISDPEIAKIVDEIAASFTVK